MSRLPHEPTQDPGAPCTCTLRFAVEDSGPGIRPEDQLRIFEPFEQAGDARSRAQGTGLGLAISRQLVRLMGGELKLRSREGQGSCFWFDLNLPVTSDSPTKPAPARTFAGYDGPRRRVLIVDDVATNRQLLTELLGPLGFDTQEATDGHQAVEMALRCQPDLILMDQAMPLMDGLEATRQLRTHATTGETPIVVLTANASSQHRQLAMQAGATAFLAKPFDHAELLGLIGQGLSLSWQPSLQPQMPPGQRPPTGLDP